MFAQGEKVALFAQNIPPATTINLVVKDFQTEINGSVSYYPLQNGLNVFQVTNPGMVYIAYFNSNNSLNDVKLNIVSGKINGYFDRETSSNNEWPELVSKTSYPYIDIRGKYTHLVYEKKALRNGSP